MANLFQDDKGNKSIGRVVFFLSAAAFHAAFLLIIYLLKDKLGENVVNLGIMYSACMATILTFKVQSKKGENKDEKVSDNSIAK